MASLSSSSSSLFLLPFHPFSPSPRLSMRRHSLSRIAASATGTEEVVVVGAGIAGLATAVSLRKLGVRSVVLEQSESLRTGGTSLTLFKNAWRVLDSIGVGDELRPKFLQIEGYDSDPKGTILVSNLLDSAVLRLVMRSEDGRELRSFTFEEEAPGQEVRAVERRELLEALASKLPPNTISFSSKLKSIKTHGSDGTLLELDDGRQLLAKIVIGCDGIRSPIAKWMGFSEPRYVGHYAFRGLGLYPEGQPFRSKVNYIYGRGLRAGFVPVSPTKVYWFICFNSGTSIPPGLRTSDQSALKTEAINLVRSWPEELLDIIQNTPEDIVVKTPLMDRWLWPGLSPPSSKGGVVVVGDAWHPMTPNLGQGGCCALEDAVILSRKLAAAIGGGQGMIDAALIDYGQERWARVFPLTVRSNLVGSLLQWENPLVCTIRNDFVIPKLVSLGPFLEHTNFECDLMEPTAST